MKNNTMQYLNPREKEVVARLAYEKVSKEKFDFKDRELFSLFKKKLEEDGFDADLKKYRINLGRSDKEIQEMKARVEDKLFPVLTVEEQKSFDMQKTLDELNKIFGDIRQREKKVITYGKTNQTAKKEIIKKIQEDKPIPDEYRLLILFETEIEYGLNQLRREDIPFFLN